MTNTYFSYNRNKMTQQVHRWVPAAAIDSFIANEESELSISNNPNEFFVPLSSHLHDSSMFGSMDPADMGDGVGGVGELGYLGMEATVTNITSTNSNMDYFLGEDGNLTRGNLTDMPQTIRFSLAFQVVIYIIYNTVFVAALLGNTLVCYVVFSSPRMRTVTNYLIANLALGDLLMALLCVPFSYISVLLQYWPFGEVLCLVVAPAQAVCVFVSAYTLVALAADRYIAILYPLRPRLRRSQAIIVIFLVWTVALLTAVPAAVYTKLIHNEINGLPECYEIWPNADHKLIYSLILMILQYFFPLAVLIFTYARIAVAVWGKKAPGEAEDGRDQRLAKAKRKMIKMMLTVVCVYTISWLPFNTIVVYGDFETSIWDWEHMPYVFPFIQWLALAHTVCNPIIYCWMNSTFRTRFRSALSNLPVLKKLRGLGFRHSNYQQQEYQLHRMNTCTTYTFATLPGKGGRNSSLVSSNGRHMTNGGSPVLCQHPCLHNHLHKHQRGSSLRSSYANNTSLLNGSTTTIDHYSSFQKVPQINPPGSNSPTLTSNCNGVNYHDDPRHLRRNTIENTNLNKILANGINSPASPSATMTANYHGVTASPPTSSLLLKAIARNNQRKRSFGRSKFLRQDSESFV